MEGSAVGDGNRPLPVAGTTATGGQLGEALVEAAVLGMGHLYSRHLGLDFGVDGTIELVNDRREVSGRQIGVQVKRGLSAARRTSRGWTLYFTERHANYWHGHSLPVIVVHVEPTTGRMRWQHADDRTIRKTRSGYAIDLPEGSDLERDFESIGNLAAEGGASVPPSERLLVLAYDPDVGITMPPEEIGFRAVAFARAAHRGERCRVVLEVAREAELVAGIDVLADVAEPDAEQLLWAAVNADDLYDLREKVGQTTRTLTLLLTNHSAIEMFGYCGDLLAAAILEAALPEPLFRQRIGDVGLEAVPDQRSFGCVVAFSVPDDAMEDFFARNPLNSTYLRRGLDGGLTMAHLPPAVVATRFMPRLMRAIVRLADREGTDDEKALASTKVHPGHWHFGWG